MEGLTSVAAILLMVLSFQQAANCYSYETYYVEDICNRVQPFNTMNAISVELTRSAKYLPHNHCTATYKTIPGRRLMAKFQMIDIESSPSCVRDYVRLYDGPSDLSRSFGKFCGFTRSSTVYVTTGNSITFKFNSDLSIQYGGFTIILTDFRPSTCSNDTTYNYRCGNRRCIAGSLECDGWNNCGDNTDETSGCPGYGIKLSIGSIAGIGIGGLIVLVLIIVFSIFGRRRWYTHHHC